LIICATATRTVPGGARRGRGGAEQGLADTRILHDLYKKTHWLMRGHTFYPLHLLMDKHADEQAELIDVLAERVQTLKRSTTPAAARRPAALLAGRTRPRTACRRSRLASRRWPWERSAKRCIATR
jgi:hypothetical protein